MRILVLGGTRFLGRHFAYRAVEAGHAVTLFHRGQSAGIGSVPGAQERIGDRDGGLSALGAGEWDSVLDTSGYVPRVVRQSAAHLGGRVGHYAFVSTISVYADFRHPGLHEESGLLSLDDPESEDVAAQYGALKAACEGVVEAAFPGRTLIVRPGLIVGPHDPSDRFTYWPMRIARPGPVLAAGRPGRAIQLIHADDLAAWTLAMMERGMTGTYNATSPPDAMTMGGLIDTCRAELAPRRRVVWADDAFLTEHKVGAWIEIPLWLPAGAGMDGMLQARVDRALAAGLHVRPLADTVVETARWAREAGRWRQRKAGLAVGRERALLASLGTGIA